MKNKKYIPFTQQPYCCVSACLQMVMYRHDIPLVEQEDLAYELGLIVPKEDAILFQKVRTSEKRPISGWGTQIQNPKYEINKVLSKLGIRLRVNAMTDIDSIEQLRQILSEVIEYDKDALLCFDYGTLWQLEYSNGGHVCVFDKLEGDTVWLVDPERNVPKSRKVDIHQLYKAIISHGRENMTGVWIVQK